LIGRGINTDASLRLSCKLNRVRDNFESI